MPGAQPRTALVVNRFVGTRPNPQSYVALLSPAVPGAAPLCEPTAPTATNGALPALVNRTAWLSGDAKDTPPLAMIEKGDPAPGQPVQAAVTVIVDVPGLNR